ncbi:MAG: porin family protein [Dysgonomonas sp.]
MKRNYFFILTLVAFLFVLNSSSANAQLVRYGLKAGIDVSDHKINSELLGVKNRVGFQLGGVLQLNVPLTGFGVETGLQYGNKSYKISNGTTEGDISNLNYLTVPIMLRKSFSIFGVAGIYFKAGVYGNVKLSGGELTLNNTKYDQKGFQTGLDTGVGVSLLNHLELGMQYRYKFSDTYDQEAAKDFKKVDRQTWTIGLAYLF